MELIKSLERLSISEHEKINERIEKEKCEETLEKLSDKNLMEKYKNSESVKKSINRLAIILQKHSVEKDKCDKIIEDYILELIPPGTKGIIRGIKFNEIIKDKILGMELDKNRFEIEFEKNHKLCATSEIADWFIYDKEKDKVLVGMNQIDLWSGGQQSNRGSKYVVENRYDSEKGKLLCVVCKPICFTGRKNKTLKLFKIGFEKDRLCYPKNLENIIRNYFDLELSD